MIPRSAQKRAPQHPINASGCLRAENQLKNTFDKYFVVFRFSLPLVLFLGPAARESTADAGPSARIPHFIFNVDVRPGKTHFSLVQRNFLSFVCYFSLSKKYVLCKHHFSSAYAVSLFSFYSWHFSFSGCALGRHCKTHSPVNMSAKNVLEEEEKWLAKTTAFFASASKQ